MSKLAELRQARAAKIDKLNTAEIVANKDAFVALEAEIQADAEHIERVERALRAAASVARPHGVDPATLAVIEAGETPSGQRSLSQIRAMAGNRVLKSFDDYLDVARIGLPAVADSATRFRTLGEQLQMIHRAAVSKGAEIDVRLARSPTDAMVTRAPTGAAEYDPAGGGFLVQVDFASAIFMLAHDLGDILGGVNKLPISANANGLKIPGVNETSRATGSRFGGVQSYWVGEGTSVTASKPTFRIVEFDLKKLMSTMYATDELLKDSTALTSIASQAFSEEVMFMTEDAIINGDGSGKPFGILNSPALVSVAKETGQAAATLVKENVDKMYSRCWSRSRKNAVWLINQDIEPQLMSLNQSVGTGGQMVYVQPGGYANAPNGQLLGRPVIATEYNATLGTVGDIMLADLSQYTIVDKSGVEMAQSMHVAFLTDEMVFRVIYRVDGKPMWNSALTPFKGTATKSPFIALASRA